MRDLGATLPVMDELRWMTFGDGDETRWPPPDDSCSRPSSPCHTGNTGDAERLSCKALRPTDHSESQAKHESQHICNVIDQRHLFSDWREQTIGQG